MVVCPNCSHQNPEGAVQCEACYTPLPEMMNCPNCGATVQSDASFCGQCGFNLKTAAQSAESAVPPPASSETVAPSASSFDVPDLVAPDPLIEPDPLPYPVPESTPAVPTSEQTSGSDINLAESGSSSPAPPSASMPVAAAPHTHLQTQTAQLLHVQTNTTIELPQHLSLVHIGKPNDRIPPDIDVSGFPDSEIVSRVHADIRVEGDAYYIEDAGSSNGTYINNLPLPTGNRHRLRSGDRIALGKGDKVSFLFRLD